MSVQLAVVVTPKSGRDEVSGWKGSELHVRVTAAPEGGKATAAVCKVIAKALGVPKSSVRVLRGEVSRHKLLEIEGVGQADLSAALGEPDPGLF
ncbi:MAG: DUF167 domain-containing protein [Coriobacteriales bacterium]|nr:DUF167 domain-containing protein [Coriobacteriales bacterium]